MSKKRTKLPGPRDRAFVLDDYPLYNLVRAAAVYNDEMSEALRAWNLSTTEWRILMLLDDKSPSSVGDLAQRSVTKLPTLTRVLARLEKDELICRCHDEEDRRFVQVTMTTKAIETLKTVQAIGQRVFERALDGVSDADALRMTQTLKQVRNNLERSPYETSVEAKERNAG